MELTIEEIKERAEAGAAAIKEVSALKRFIDSATKRGLEGLATELAMLSDARAELVAKAKRYKALARNAAKVSEQYAELEGETEGDEEENDGSDE